MFHGVHVQHLCGIYTRSRIAGSLVYVCSNLEDNARIVFRVIVPIPSTEYEDSYCSVVSPTLGINSLFNFSPSEGYISMIPNEIEYFFLNLLAVWISSFFIIITI